MDCCSKYPDFRHHLIGGNAIATAEGGTLNNSYYGHAHPSMRYQQSMYRLTTSGSGGYNGIGPPIAATPGLYPNYERYGNFSNLPPYVYNANGFGYGNLSGRDVAGYYGQYESLSRGGGFSYHNYRGLHDAALHVPRNPGYHIYTHSAAGREAHSNFSGLHSHSSLNHHHSHPNQMHHYKDSFMTQLSDMPSGNSRDSRRYGSVNDGNSFNSDATVPPQMNGNTDREIEGSLGQINYPNLGTTYQSNDILSDSGTSPQQHDEQTSPHGVHQISTGFPYGLKESKQRNCAREKDKYLSKASSSNRRSECTTPLNISPKLERADTPFTTHHVNITSSQSNRIQNNYLQSSASNGNLSPFPNSPSSWPPQSSPRLLKKTPYSPASQPSPVSIPNKNRVLECDFIPCRRSKKKIKNEQSDDTHEFREEIKDITPLPGFQQAFGSTEIGRFSETFLNTPDSPYDQVYESEADTLSPQPWETGDSLEGPHFNLHIGASVQPVYSENHRTIESPIGGHHFSGIRCSNY